MFFTFNPLICLTFPSIMTWRKKAFENIVGKIENAGKNLNSSNFNFFVCKCFEFGAVYKNTSNCVRGQNWHRLCGHKFYIGLYREN